MSVLRRNMFRGGGYAHRGTGITSGLDTPKRGYVDGPGSYAGKRTLDDFMTESRSTLDNLYEPRQETSRLKEASPALLALGAALLSGKSYQSGVGGALEILGGATEKAVPYFDDMIKSRRAAKEADRKEDLQMNLQALQMAREDYKDYEDKFKPFQLGENTLRYNEETDSYDTIATKPSKLIQVYNSETDQREFVPESLVRAESELANANPGYTSKYLVEKEVTDIVEAYDNTKKKFVYVSKEALDASVAADDGKYSPKGPDTSYVEVYDSTENRNIFLNETTFNTEVAAGNNRYQPKKEGLDTFKEVYSKSLGANIYVTQGDLAFDNAKEGERDFSAPKDDPSYNTYYDPIIKKNVLATKDDVTARINDDDPNNDFAPKETALSDTILTLKNKATGQNVLVSKQFALANMDKFEPADKAQTTKSAIDTQTNKLVFVSNEDILNNPERYQPAILGQSLTIGANGEVTLKEDLIGADGGIEPTTKQQDSYLILEDLNLRTSELYSKMQDTPEWYFGVSGGFVDFYNKYITQLGLPFNEQAAQIRNDVNILGQTVLRSISGDSRFTNEDREYIQEITGKEAMDKFQSYEQVLNAISQTQLLLEDRLSEAAGGMGLKPSHEMDAADLYAAYNNFRIDNKIDFKGSENYVRRNDLPALNLSQMKRRLKAFHYDIYNQYYLPDGRPRPQE